jgi:hypothetical protein
MSDTLQTLLLIIGGLGGISGIGVLVKFWMDYGTLRTEVRDARSQMSTAIAKSDLLDSRFSAYALDAAEKYATVKEVAMAEARLASAVDSMRQDLRSFYDSVNKLVFELIKHRDGAT